MKANKNASMRPQHITAENVNLEDRTMLNASCFNEAAAYHCGKPAIFFQAAVPAPASMRPQHITAENQSSRKSP